MRTVRFHEVGEADVLKLEETTLREPKAGEARIRMRSIGLNRAEAMFRRGHYLETPKLPAGIGYEGAGHVQSVGPDVSGFKTGDAVCIIPGFSMNDYPVYGEEALVPVHALVAKPESLSWEEAASVWMQYLTAWGGIVSVAKLTRGEAVIIPAASSSVGLAAIQIVNKLGGIAIAVTRTAAKRDEIRSAGAAHVIVSNDQSLVDEVQRITGGKGARIVFDPVAGSGVEALAEATSSGGILILYGRLAQDATPFPLMAGMRKGLTMRAYTLHEILGDPERFEEGKRFVFAGLEDGTLKPVIAKSFPLESVVDAHRYLESNEQIGKVVMTVA